MEEKKGSYLLITVGTSIISLIILLNSVIPEVKAIWREWQTEWNQEIARERVLDGRHHMEQRHWQEAKRRFTEAQNYDSNSIPALIGYAQATVHIDGDEAALQVLADCTDDLCTQERKVLHQHAFEGYIKQGVNRDNIEAVWSHALQVFNPACATEKVMLSQAHASAEERAEVYRALSGSLETLITETVSTALTQAKGAMGGYSQPLVNLFSEATATITAGSTTQQIFELGAQRGTEAIRDQASLGGSACAWIATKWTKDQRTLTRALAYESTIHAAIIGQDAPSNPMIPLAREISRNDYSNTLNELYDLGAARALLQEQDFKCSEGCPVDAGDTEE